MSASIQPRRAAADLETLVRLFYPSTDCLGRFEEADRESLPPEYRRLLAHNQHMTVTVESYHRSSVDLKVLSEEASPTHYWRKILLLRQSDHAVVQFGIVRLTFGFLPPEVRQKIEERKAPLGRILISHNVLRRVELVALWKVTPGAELSQLFQLGGSRQTFGRTARIYCHGDPAIELLEIVAPVARS